MESFIAALPPILSAAISGLVTYLTMRSNNRLSATDKEFAYMQKERERYSEIAMNTIEANKDQITELQIQIINLQEKLEKKDQEEEECQRTILQYKYKVRELELKLSLLNK